MKNPVVQFSIVVLAFVALAFVMAYTKPMADDQPKEYIILSRGLPDRLQTDVNQKLSEGWRLQGGVSLGNGTFVQAMVK